MTQTLVLTPADGDTYWESLPADERDWLLDEYQSEQYWLNYDEGEAQAELEAERRNELFWENRAVDDGFAEWEARRGVVDYWEAKANAEALDGKAV